MTSFVFSLLQFIAILSLATTTRNHYHRRQDIETLTDSESADLEKLDRRNHDMIVNRAFGDDAIPGERVRSFCKTERR